jgi:hypothetical protein
MGRFDYWTTKSERVEKENPSYNSWNRYSYDYIYHDVNKGKHYYFIPKGDEVNSYYTLKLKSLGDKFIECVSAECVENYAELFDKLECTTSYSPYDKSKDTYELRAFEDFEQKVKENRYDDNKFFGNINGQFQKLQITKYSQLNNEELNKRDGYFVRITGQENFKYVGSYWDRKSIFVEPLFSGTIEEIYNKFQPSLKCKYLKNNKLNGKDKN